jgi:hypothetical protein
VELAVVEGVVVSAPAGSRNTAVRAMLKAAAPTDLAMMVFIWFL